MAATYNWAEFRLRIDIKASKQAIYDAWTTQELIKLWFLKDVKTFNSAVEEKDCSEPFEEGDRYQWWWYGYDNYGDEETQLGFILRANGTDTFSFSFGVAGDCHVRIYEEEGEHIVELLQDQIPIDERSRHEHHLGCKTGWTFFLANLKSVLEGGNDLRNKNMHLVRMLNS